MKYFHFRLTTYLTFLFLTPNGNQYLTLKPPDLHTNILAQSNVNSMSQMLSTTGITLGLPNVKSLTQSLSLLSRVCSIGILTTVFYVKIIGQCSNSSYHAHGGGGQKSRL